MHSPKNLYQAIAIIGPTACGKSQLAYKIAEYFPVEIISMDSAQIYLGMDIGTAKPSRLEQEQIPHHLIDILDPVAAYSAAQFVATVQEKIQSIRARQHLPLIVGGTMLYFKAMMQGLDDLPAADAQIRQTLLEEAEQHGWPTLHARLRELDPISAERLKPNDSQRIQRALEIIEITGRPLSSLLTKTSNTSFADTIRTIALEPSDRNVLHERIAKRFDQMLVQGFLDEVKMLRARGDLNATLPSMRCVGYRQAWHYLEANEHDQNSQSFANFREHAIIATRQLAKRQITWLRSFENCQRFDCLDEKIFEKIQTLINSMM